MFLSEMMFCSDYITKRPAFDLPSQELRKPTFNLPPLSSSLNFSLASTVLFKSLCKRRPKSLNMVEPPERTMFCVGKENKTIMTFILKDKQSKDKYTRNSIVKIQVLK